MNKKVKALCEGAMMVALAIILDLLKEVLPGQLPNGGALFNISTLPIIFFAVRHGLGWGSLAGFVFGTLNYFVGNGISIDWTTIICDYFLAFTLCGLGAGLFKGKKLGAIWGTMVGVTLQFLSSYFVGVFVWGKWMPDEFLGMTMTSPWIYSFLYNICWAIPNMILTALIFFLLYRIKPMSKLLNGQDLLA